MSKQSAKRKAPPSYEMSDDGQPFGQAIQGAKTLAEAAFAAGKPVLNTIGIPVAPTTVISKFASDHERRAESLRLEQWTQAYSDMLGRRGLRIDVVGEDGATVIHQVCLQEFQIPTTSGPSEESMRCPFCR